MYVRLPDDYKFPTISPETTASPTLCTADTADSHHADSPVTETVPQCTTDDIDAIAASQSVRQLPRRSSATRLHLPRFQYRRTTRRRVAVSSRFISAGSTDTDSGLYTVKY